MRKQTLMLLTTILSSVVMSACTSGNAINPSSQSTPVLSATTATTPPTPVPAQPTPTSQFQPIATKTPEALLRAPMTADFGSDTTFKDPEGFFTIKYPTKWVARKSGSEMQFLSDKTGEVGIALSLHIKTLSASSLADDISTLLEDRRDAYKEQSHKSITSNGAEVIWIDHTYTSDSTAYRGFIAATVRNRIGFLVIGWAPKQDYSKYDAVFRAMSASLRPLEYDEAPPYADWQTHETDHFTFYYLPDTYAAEDIENIAAEHETVYNDIIETLKLNYDKPITIFLYPSEEALYRATARKSGHAITEAGEVHSLWIAEDDHQSTGHEMTHVITAQAIGEPSEAVLGEGIAVCMDHSGNNPHITAARLLKSQKLVALNDMLGDVWFEQDAEVAYPESGSFACYLLQKNGVQRFKRIYTETDFNAALKTIYGTNLTTLEKKWLDMLRAMK